MLLPTRDAEELMTYMSELSEDAYCAGWMMDLEYDLWGAVVAGTRAYGRVNLDEQVISKLRSLSERCGGWVVFDDVEGEVWLPIEEWERRFAAWRSSSQDPSNDHRAQASGRG